MSYQLIIGDCIDSLPRIPDGSVNCCVTSPPYFGLRDYGVDGQIGLEQTPEEYVAKMVEVFREVRRVLRDDGTLWLNIGDSYANGGRKTRDHDSKLPARHLSTRPDDGDGVKPKDLIGIPWMLAFALRADGWYLRQEIIWHKPNPMPESVKDRCTKAHEQIFLLSKSPRYHFDNEAMQEPATTEPRGSSHSFSRKTATTPPPGSPANFRENRDAVQYAGTRNRRSVWSVATRPYRGAHFATFPPELIEPCILAGCPAGGVVLDPFGGSGTTAGVAVAHGRKAIICELNPEYGKLVHDRVNSIASIALKGANLSERIQKQCDLFDGDAA
ncbi:DNA-methyltransferase [Aeromonas veronii]|uniref:DNA-methyltransferase n=1 Tax=Aeromonas veronii TaxID=654 RepID=UPI001932A3EA|nr:site-specific DNA-methyltransferase [Aeromonas veronii]MBM0416270.1 site-specific DNA-methyltransferase [Aeromonas veronii]MBW3788879.1 site-specific DNA-methyltransferase [Aeromonas veronii]